MPSRSSMLTPSPPLPRKRGREQTGPVARRTLTSGERYSILIFPFFATSPHCASSRAMILANSSEVLPAG